MGARVERCLRCFLKPQGCYCGKIRAFDPGLRFVILIQYREAKRHVATGRLSHLCLQNSELIEGYDYTHDPRVNEILADPRLFPLVLYPGHGSVNLSRLGEGEKRSLFPAHKEPVVFVIDGTWTSARKTMQRSANLASLPRISFDLAAPSRIRLRQQPAAHCLSTVEAIHRVVELLGKAPAHRDHLLEVFDFMVDQQVRLTPAVRRPRSLARNALKITAETADRESR